MDGRQVAIHGLLAANVDHTECGEWAAAKIQFDELLHLRPTDGPTKTILKAMEVRCYPAAMCFVGDICIFAVLLA